MMRMVVIACKVLEGLFENCSDNPQVQYMDYGHHRYPKRMRQVLQKQIDDILEPSMILMGYGLCGNGLLGLNAREHTLVIPRCDDCISILLGSYEAYWKEFSTNPGTYYLSKGWLESGSHPLKEYEEYVAKYGEKKGRWLIDQIYHNYKRIALVGYNEEELSHYRDTAKKVADFINAAYVEILGSDNLIRRLMGMADHLSELDPDFVVIQPREYVTQDKFLR